MLASKSTAASPVGTAPAAQAAHRALTRRASHRVRVLEAVGIPVRGVPVVALHRAALLGHHAAADARLGIREAAEEAARVGEDEIGVVAGDRGALGVGDALVHGERRRLGAPRELDGLVDGEAPRVVEVQVRGRAAVQARRVGQPRGGILGGVAGDGAGGFDSARERLGREVRRARVAAPRAEIHGDAEALVAVVLHRLHLAAAHGHALAHGGRHLDLRIARALFARHLEALERHLRHGVA